MHYVAQFHVEDHVSPLMKALDDMRLKLPDRAFLPILPGDPIRVETSFTAGSVLSVSLKPSAALLCWAAELVRQSESPDMSMAEGHSVAGDGTVSRVLRPVR